MREPTLHSYKLVLTTSAFLQQCAELQHLRFLYSVPTRMQTMKLWQEEMKPVTLQKAAEDDSC